MPKPAKHALTVLAAPELRVAKDDLKKLQAAAVAQLRAVAEMDSNAAKAAILCGLTLHRVKASMPGNFREWVEEMLPKGNMWTPKTAVKNASYYMRLALAFLEKTKLAKPDLLALGDGTAALDLTDKATAKKFLAKLTEFIGEHSTNELLIKHGIKGVNLKSALDAEIEAETGDDDALTPAQRLKAQREATWQEAWNSVQLVRATLTEPEKIQLLNDAKHLATLKAELIETAKLADERLKALGK